MPGFSLNQKMLNEALEYLKTKPYEGEGDSVGNQAWRNLMIDEQLKILQTHANPYITLQKHGGQWLGVLREWIKCKAINGENVTWSSTTDVLRFSYALTPAFLEDLAAHIAAAAINETKGHY